MAAKRAYQTRDWDLPLQNSFNLLRSAGDWWEMMFASATTIGLRLGGIQQNFNSNRPADTAELMRMVTEKNAAWWQAGWAVLEWQRAMFTLYSDLASREMSRVAPMAVGTAAMGPRYAALPNQLAAASLRGFADVMKPYHAKSTANARRLSRKAANR